MAVGGYVARLLGNQNIIKYNIHIDSKRLVRYKTDMTEIYSEIGTSLSDSSIENTT